MSVILYIAMSLDGFIAGPGSDLGFLSPMEEEGEDYGYADFVKAIRVPKVTRSVISNSTVPCVARYSLVINPATKSDTLK